MSKLFYKKIPKKIYKEFKDVGISKTLLDKIYENKSAAMDILINSQQANLSNIILLTNHGAKINNPIILLKDYLKKYEIDINILKWFMTNFNKILKYNSNLLFLLCESQNITPEILELVIKYTDDINCERTRPYLIKQETPLDSLLSNNYITLKNKIDCIKIMQNQNAIINLPFSKYHDNKIIYLFFNSKISEDLFDYEMIFELTRYKQLINLFCRRIPIEIIKKIIKKFDILTELLSKSWYEKFMEPRSVEYVD